jgi:hypothetical protein
MFGPKNDEAPVAGGFVVLADATSTTPSTSSTSSMDGRFSRSL